MVNSSRRKLAGGKGQVSNGMVDLPLEIISDILIRLPIESIMSCRVVCKSWYGLTQDPNFINMHLSRSNCQPNRIILHNYTGNHLLLLDTEEHKIERNPIQNMLLNGHQVMCSCNGLLCIASYYKLDPVFICNPITGKHMVLPSTDSKVRSVNHKVGLGFDPSTGTYKVVRFYRDKSGVGRFEILSLGESSWKELSAPRSITGWDAYGPVFWNGTLCWVMTSPVCTKISILAFDLIEEKFQLISLPKEFPSFELPYFDLQDLDGYLTFVEHESNLMKLWRLTGKKIGDFSLCLEETHDTHVRWNGWLSYAILGGLNRNHYLLEVRFFEGQQHPKTHITRFFPETLQYVHVDIPDLPVHFKATCFKPSLVSPLAAASRLS